MNTKVISLRVDEDLLLEVDKRADLCGRSRNWVVGMILGNWAKLPVAAKEIMLGSKNMAREEHVPGILEAGILAAEEFDRREEESFIARLPDVGGTPRLRRLGKAVCPGCGTLDGRHLDWCKEKPLGEIAGEYVDAMIGNLREAGKQREAKKIATIAGGEDGEKAAGEAIQDVAAGGTAEGVQPGGKGGGGTSDDRVEAILRECHNPLAAEEEKGVGDSCALPKKIAAGDWLNVDCISCWEKHPERTPFNRPFIVCPTCGNKRCPKATSHELACTGSNEAGQEGSVYKKIESIGRGSWGDSLPREELRGDLDAPPLTKQQVDSPDFGAPEWSEARLREIAEQEPGGPITACSPEALEKLREICAGNLRGAQQAGNMAQDTDSEDERGGAQEVDLCGFKSYNEVDGENYICGLEKHGPKTKHGGWIKV